MRFQSKKHKRMKQSCVSFLANDLSFMASRIPVTVMQALVVTMRDVVCRVPMLHRQQPSQSTLKMSKSSLCRGAHGQTFLPCFLLEDANTLLGFFCFVLFFFQHLQAIRQPRNELSSLNDHTVQSGYSALP